MSPTPGEADDHVAARNAAEAAPSLTGRWEGAAAHAQGSQQFQDELSALRQRETEIIKLLGCDSPDRIVHDVRNLLNEVQLLRYLAERQNS